MAPKQQEDDLADTQLPDSDGDFPDGDAATAEAPFDADEALQEAVRLHETGFQSEAFEMCRKIKTAYPDNAGAYNLAGIIAFQGNHRRRSLHLLRKAIRLAPDHAGAHNNLGIVLKESGEFGEAVEAFEKSLQINPDDADTHFNLGNALNGLQRHADAAVSYGRAAELRPDFVDALYNRANMLAEMGRYELAVDTFRRVIDFISDFAGAHYALGKSLMLSGRFEEAIAAFEEALIFEPGHKHALDGLTEAVLRARGPEALLTICDARLESDPGNRIALSAKAIALHEVGETAAAKDLLDFERFVRPVRIAPPEGFGDIAEFNAALTDHVTNHPSLKQSPDGHATRNGLHSGNLNKSPKGPIAAFEKSIAAATKDYVSALSKTQPHPFLDIIAPKSRHVIWAVVMSSQGHQIPHIHPEAWLSGVYYPKLPAIVDEPNANKAGWIEFGSPPDRFACKKAPEVWTYKPEEGLMILFPSYFYHRTIPFDAAEPRVSIAFDVIAVD